jgi:hypothetical protein
MWTTKRMSAVVAVGCILLPLALLMAGCGRDLSKPNAANEVVVFGFLYVGEAVSDRSIWIARTRPVDQVYRIGEAAVTGATVLLRRTDTGAVDTLGMSEPGWYGNPHVRIDRRTRYELTIKKGNATLITASTTTPESFTVQDGPRQNQVMRQEAIADSFPIILTCPNPEQIFMVDVYCTERWEDARYIHAFSDGETVKSFDEYGGEDGPPRRNFTYFRIKNLDHNGDLYRVSWYGDMMVFYGGYQVQVLSIDENYYNYLYRERPELSGGIQGGIGVFGSAHRARYTVRAAE